MADRRLAQCKIRIGDDTHTFENWTRSPDFLSDARVYLGLLVRYSDHIHDNPVAADQLTEVARRLRKSATRFHHGAAIRDDEAVACARDAKSVLYKLGHDGVAEAVLDLARPPTIGYIAPLRRLLVQRAKKTNPCLTYQEAAAAIGLSWDPFGERQLYRQLNVLAANQLLLGEPQLCALVVLPKKGIPGDGFYWIVDLPREAADEVKKQRHTQLVEEIKRFPWPPSASPSSHSSHAQDMSSASKPKRRARA